MTPKFKVGDIVWIDPTRQNVDYSKYWTRDAIHGPLKIYKITQGTWVNNFVEPAEGNLALAHSEEWYFYDEELTAGEYLTAVWRRRHGA